MKRIKKYIAEFIGTFLLVFIGTSSIVIVKENTLTISLAFGLTVIALIYSVGSVSGANLNPAVTTAMVINKRLNYIDGLFYIVAQFFGAILASFLLYVCIRALGLSPAEYGQTDFSHIPVGLAFFIETLFTCLFVVVVLIATNTKKQKNEIYGIVIGFTLVAFAIAAIPLTGASFNPARSLGPALFARGTALSQYWLYFSAPILGGGMAAFFAKYMGSEEE